VRNCIISHGVGAGIALYSSANATVVFNTLYNVSAQTGAALLLNVSPKQVSRAASV
jgi:hypothetical protein